MSVQRQLACNLHAGEDDEVDFILELVQHSVLVTSGQTGGCALRRGSG